MDLLTMTELNSKDRVKAIQSQKAAALFKHKAASKAYAIPQDWEQPDSVVLHLTDTVLHAMSAGACIGYPCFLRACPETPRHGVIESYKCADEAELLKQFRELCYVMKDKVFTDDDGNEYIGMDPNGCLILMPFIEADSSCVMALSYHEREVIKGEDGKPTGELGDKLYKTITDENGEETKVAQYFNGYTIMGVGHDGITAGHGFNLGFPHSIESHKKDSQILDFLEFSPQIHECEFVFKPELIHRNKRGVVDFPSHQLSSHTSFFTQIRKAPEHTPVHPPPEGVDTIGMVPQGEVVVKEVFKATGLEEVAWLEENITKEKCPDGFVVQEAGGSRLSHIYAHCRGEAVPYIIGEVNEGERWVEAAIGWVVLDPNGEWEPKPYNPSIYASDFERGVKMGNLHWAKQQGWFSTFFHQWVSLPMGKPQDVAFLAGMFASWLAKAILALGLGEMRHAKNLKKNANAPLFATITACVGSNVWKKITKTPYLDSNRSHYYAAIGHLELNWEHAAQLCEFLNRNYRNGWSSSYGGPKWGDSMLVGAELCREIGAYLSDPNATFTITNEDGEEVEETALERIMKAVNKAENTTHNNGMLFNKWLSKRAFDAGTGGFSPRQDLDAMSTTFKMARQFLDDDFEHDVPMIPAEPPVNDWGKILKFVGKRTPTYWRNNPIAISNKAPESLKEVMNILPVGWRHGDAGSHNNPTNKDFIMCGVTSCQICEAHINWATKNPKQVSVPALQEIKSIFDSATAGIMIAPADLDVWLVGSVEETRASVKSQVELIKAKQFDPTPEEFKHIFNALNPNDLDTPDMMLVLNKWLAKKGDDLPDFLEKLTGKKMDTKGFVASMEGDDE